MTFYNRKICFTYFREIRSDDLISTSSRSDCTLIRIKFLSVLPDSLNFANSASESCVTFKYIQAE